MIYQSGTAKSKGKKQTKAERRAERAAERRMNSGKGAASGKKEDQAVGSHGEEHTGMKQSVTIAANRHSVSAEIPAGVNAYRFLLIDGSQFLQYSDLQTVK